MDLERMRALLAALQEARAAACAEGIRLGVPEDRLQTLPLPHPAHMLPAL